ncbi:hypothetical protein PMAYCL1PPCAC_30230, partial [Pristionchus mayeri]
MESEQFRMKIKDQRSWLEVDEACGGRLLVLAVDRRRYDDVGEGRSAKDDIGTATECSTDCRVDQLFRGRGRTNHLLKEDLPQFYIIALVFEGRTQGIFHLLVLLLLPCSLCCPFYELVVVRRTRTLSLVLLLENLLQFIVLFSFFRWRVFPPFLLIPRCMECNLVLPSIGSHCIIVQ